jgi:hypothetical protein
MKTSLDPFAADSLAAVAGATKGPGALLAKALATGMLLFETGNLPALSEFRVRKNVHAFPLGEMPVRAGRAERSKEFTRSKRLDSFPLVHKF